MIKDYQQQKTLRDGYDFCIIGAGPAGITLGLRLAAARTTAEQQLSRSVPDATPDRLQHHAVLAGLRQAPSQP